VKGHPERAGKITGMILEMDNSDILKLLSNPQLLDAQVEEAAMVLFQHVASTGTTHLQDALATMSPERQKNELGERLYSLIVKGHPERAGKITGMILEMDNADILNLLSNPQMLDAQVEEAVMVLSQHIASTAHGAC